ncbi:MAG: HNH endonuclease [Balneolaceae bacterium]
MARIVDPQLRMAAIEMMVGGKGQREISRVLGLSRVYLRTLADEIGYQFPRNGIEVKGELIVCLFCGSPFFRPRSKVDRASNHFCSNYCKGQAMRGSLHRSWKDGSTYDKWFDEISQKAEYKKWRKAVLARDSNKCVVCGNTEELQAHHIKHKSDEEFKHLVFEVSNGVTLCEKCHQTAHSKAKILIEQVVEEKMRKNNE